MTYAVFILRRAQKELEDLLREVYGRICQAILGLAADPRPSGCRKLSGRDGWRIRVGAYRVVYEIDDDARRIAVLHIGHRRDVYR
jgi:mRNA interferase RelE/StbE